MLAIAGLLALVASAAAYLDPLKPDSKIARNVLEGKAEGYCSPSGPIEATNCAYETVESLNKELFPSLHKLVSNPFFKYYKVDLYRECPFWRENGFCMNRACGVEAADESEVPEKWRAQALSEVRLTPEDGISSCYFRDDDFCYIEDDATPEGQYIDLSLNPERFTGYAGDSANAVWRAIYKENCFGLSEAALEAARNGGLGYGLNRLSEGYGTEMVKHPFVSDVCEEKKLYYRLISGLHASISIHICADYLDQSTGEWSPNLQCFISRLATHPERLSNVYFNAVLLMRAVARAAPYFRAYDIGITPPGQRASDCSAAQRATDAQTRAAFDSVLALAERADIANGFAEADFFRGPDAPFLKEEFKGRFRNVSRIMDCVGCDKCRLWGKLQVSGFGTALKILFALDERDLDPKLNPDLLQRSEVVALFNTLHRVTESLSAVEDFRRIYAETKAAEMAALPKRQEESRRRFEALQEWRRSQWWFDPHALGAGLLALLEAVRRGCNGCVEGLVRLLQGRGKAEL